MLSIQHLTKQYSSNKGIFDLSLEIQPGDLYAFIGHNGAGKTTALKSICGILPIDDGQISLNGISLQEAPIEFKKKLAYIPDNPDIYDFLTGNQYLNFIADIFEIDRSTRQKRITELAKQFDILEALGDMISSYSHGMKQKLVIISALVHDPDLLVLDEPFVGLDPAASLTLKNIMKEMCRQNKMIFFSTHVLEVAEKICSKVAIIKDGHLITSGKMEDIKGDDSLEDVFMELIQYENIDESM